MSYIWSEGCNIISSHSSILLYYMTWHNITITAHFSDHPFSGGKNMKAVTHFKRRPVLFFFTKIFKIICRPVKKVYISKAMEKIIIPLLCFLRSLFMKIMIYSDSSGVLKLVFEFLESGYIFKINHKTLDELF